MEDIKNSIINQITFEIDKTNDFNSEDIERIKNIIIIQLKDYDIVSRKNEIVVSNRTNTELWKRFFLTKKAENVQLFCHNFYLSFNRMILFYRKLYNKFECVSQLDFILYFQFGPRN